MVLHRNLANLAQQVNSLRVDFLHLLCLERLYEKEEAKEDTKVHKRVGKKFLVRKE